MTQSSESGEAKNTSRKYSKRQPVSVNTALHSMLKEYNLVDGFTRYQFVLRWPEIVGDEIAKRTQPECIRGTTLVVSVCNSAWAQELSFQKQIILNRLNNFKEKGKDLTDITFHVTGK